MKDREEKPSFFRGFFGGFVKNLPLLLGGVLLLIIGLAVPSRICRLLSYSLFIAYALSTAVQGFYGVSSAGMQRREEKDREKEEKEKKEKRAEATETEKKEKREK